MRAHLPSRMVSQGDDERPSIASAPAGIAQLQRYVGNRALARALSSAPRRTLARAPTPKSGKIFTDPDLPNVELELLDAAFDISNPRRRMRFKVVGRPDITLFYGGQTLSWSVAGAGKGLLELTPAEVQSLISGQAAAPSPPPPRTAVDVQHDRQRLDAEFATTWSRVQLERLRLRAQRLQTEAASMSAYAETAALGTVLQAINSRLLGFGAVAPIAQAAQAFYANVALYAPAPGAPPDPVTLHNVPIANQPGAHMQLRTLPLHAVGTGLGWWASAAMMLRRVAETLDPHHAVGEIRLLTVAGAPVPIVVRAPQASIPRGEYIVVNETTPLLYTPPPALPPGSPPGVRQPEPELGTAKGAAAGAGDRVSYPEFTRRLRSLCPGPRDEQDVAGLLLRMVARPDVAACAAGPLLTLMRELLVTILVAEPARHRSVLFNSVLTLEAIARGDLSFANAFSDTGAFPMTGEGTGAGGRRAEAQEERLRGDPAADVVLDAVVRRQAQQFALLDPAQTIAGMAAKYQ